MKDIENEHQKMKYIEAYNNPEKVAETMMNEQNSVATKALEHYTSQESWQETMKRYRSSSISIKRLDAVFVIVSHFVAMNLIPQR